MSCNFSVPKNIFAENLGIAGRVASSRTYLPILSNVLLSRDEDQLRLSATDLSVSVIAWMDARMDGDLRLTLPAKTLFDVIRSLTEAEVNFSVNGKPEVSLHCGTFKGIVKGVQAADYPTIPDHKEVNGYSIETNLFKEMVQKVVFAASTEDARPVLTGILLHLDEKFVSMVATDGYRLAIARTDLMARFEKQQLIIPALALKEALRILNNLHPDQVELILPPDSGQLVLRFEHVEIIAQLIDGNYPDYQAVVPDGYQTRAVINTADLIKACKQASIIARESNDVVHFHFIPPYINESRTVVEEKGKLILRAEADETGTSEVRLDTDISGQDLKIALNVRFLLDGLETIKTKNVVLEAKAKNNPVVLHSTGDDDHKYVLMPMFTN